MPECSSHTVLYHILSKIKNLLATQSYNALLSFLPYLLLTRWWYEALKVPKYSFQVRLKRAQSGDTKLHF